MEQDYNNFAPRLGVAWDISGNSKTALRAGIGHFFLRQRVTPQLSLAANPPFTSTIAGARTFDSIQCFGCSSSLGVPIRGVEVENKTPHNWQWNVTLQHEVFRRSTIEVGYVANYGYDLLRMQVANQVFNGDTNANGVDDRREFVLMPADVARRLRQFSQLDSNINIGLWTHTGESRYDSLQTQWITRFGRGSQFQTSYTLARPGQISGSPPAASSPRTTSCWTTRISISTGAAPTPPGRTSTMPPSSGCCHCWRTAQS